MVSLLITGSTGYIGGSILSTILESKSLLIKDLKISVLVRKPEHVGVLEQKGLNVILFSGLDDTDAIKNAASEHDIVINAANSYHPQSAEAIIDGLAERQNVTGNPVHLIHTSGTSNLGDRPITGTYTETRAFSDEEDIFAYESYREGLEKYAQRTTDIVVVQKGEAVNIKTYIIMPPTIYGIGSGFFNRTSIQIDAIMRAAKRDGFTTVIGEGKGQWDHVHVDNLAELYELVISRILKGEELPSNRKGIYFSESGSHSWREVSGRIAKTGKEAGFLSSDEVREQTLENAAKAFEKSLDVAELGFASHSQTRANLSRKIGWVPKKNRKDFEDSFLEEWEIIGREEP